MLHQLRSAVLGALLAGTSTAAAAGTISHLNYWDFGFINYSALLDPAAPGYRGPIGQTFTAIDTHLTSITVGLVSPYAFLWLETGEAATDPITVTLYQGAGFDGPVLATRSAVPTHYGYFGVGLYGMNPIPFPAKGLIIGETYTYKISGISDEVYATYGTDPYFETGYPGGEAIFDGAFQPDFDLDFIITGFTPAVDVQAPASLALFGMALIGIALVATRRRGKSSPSAVSCT
jgi:hypothetical protein